MVSGLDVSHNRLSVLPDDLSNLKQLVVFNLSSNLFESLPTVLSTMVSLKSVNLSGNKVSRVSSEELCSVSNLETLDLRNNPFDDDTKVQLSTVSVGNLTISYDS